MKELKPLVPLIKIREGMGLTQEQFAKLTGISRQMLSHIERGASNPSLLVAYKIAKVSNKTIEQIFFSRNAQKMSKQSA
jgi:putative transcriptional regulator